MREAIPALLLAILGAAVALGTQEASDPVERLHRVREQIRALERKAEKTGDRERNLVQEVQRLDRLAALHREELAVVTARTNEVIEKSKTSDLRLAKLEGELDDKARRLVRRMEEVRRVGRLGYLGALLARTRSEGFLTALRQLTRLADRDRRQVREIRDRMAELERIRDDLDRTERELARLRRESAQAERHHRSVRAEKTRLLDSLRAERRQTLQLKRELEEAEQNLQKMVGGLSGSAGSEALHVPLRLYKGELAWPVKGKVTQEFGRVGSTRFDIPYPGIDLWAPIDTPVRAVSSGTVVFADWFHGYGKTVCLDHGEGYITVYAHLSEILVTPGQNVARGETLARLGDTGSLKGPHLYFQISKDGEPLDPRDWLAAS